MRSAMSKEKVSSYQQRVKENHELRLKNKELSMKVVELMKAVEILNKCIYDVSKIRESMDFDLVEQYEELCKEMRENKE